MKVYKNTGFPFSCFLKALLFYMCLLCILSCTIKKQNSEIIVLKNIFEDLFTDVPKDYNEFTGKKGFEITEVFPDDYLRPEKEIWVKNDSFSIVYYPGYYVNTDDDTFIPYCVNIDKKNDEITLGNYIGENFEILSRHFVNEIVHTSYVDFWPDHEPFTSHSYGGQMNSTSSFVRIYLSVHIIDNIIIGIRYGYEI
ncbi:MAG: hypothetical protein FWG46_04475 [Treponema sp.]|nr:hypothetical protein [Treponema sp.]